MFYQPELGHDLPHNPFNAIVTPRPIAWVSTRDKNGADNLAPYSFFNGVAYNPPQVIFANTGGKADRENGKDSVSIIQETGVFCINVVEYAMKDVMNKTSAGVEAGVDEFALAEIEKAECKTIDCPRVQGAPAALECKLTQIVRLKGAENLVVFGEVIGVHMRDDCIVDGMFDVSTYRPLSRLGYRDYSVVDNIFSLARPDD